MDKTVLPATKHSLEKLELLLYEAGCKVRYERGNFKSGHCLLQSDKVIVVNKFIPLEQKILALMSILSEIELDESRLKEKERAFYLKLKQVSLDL